MWQTVSLTTARPSGRSFEEMSPASASYCTQTDMFMSEVPSGVNRRTSDGWSTSGSRPVLSVPDRMVFGSENDVRFRPIDAEFGARASEDGLICLYICHKGQNTRKMAFRPWGGTRRSALVGEVRGSSVHPGRGQATGQARSVAVHLGEQFSSTTDSQGRTREAGNSPWSLSDRRLATWDGSRVGQPRTTPVGRIARSDRFPTISPIKADPCDRRRTKGSDSVGRVRAGTRVRSSVIGAQLSGRDREGLLPASGPCPDVAASRINSSPVFNHGHSRYALAKLSVHVPMVGQTARPAPFKDGQTASQRSKLSVCVRSLGPTEVTGSFKDGHRPSGASTDVRVCA